MRLLLLIAALTANCHAAIIFSNFTGSLNGIGLNFFDTQVRIAFTAGSGLSLSSGNLGGDLVPMGSAMPGPSSLALFTLIGLALLARKLFARRRD